MDVVTLSRLQFALTALACAFAILNALWFELDADKKADKTADKQI